MATICKKHHKNLVKSRQIAELVFQQEFFSLWEELHYLYKKLDINEAKKEAFQDAFYSFIVQEDCDKSTLKKTLFF